jgi:hypothetical protein
MPKCEDCDAEHAEVYLHSRCHPEEPTWAVVSGHTIRIECSVCEDTIVTLPLGPLPSVLAPLSQN